jgi:hypothetical protein
MTAEPGPLGEEAARLVEAFADWARGAAPWATAHLHDLPIASDSAECKLCPLCQALSMLRHTRPESFAHLADATSSLLAAARTMLESVDVAGRHADPGVERITLDDDAAAPPLTDATGGLRR